MIPADLVLLPIIAFIAAGIIWLIILGVSKLFGTKVNRHEQ